MSPKGLSVANEGGEQFLYWADNARHQIIKTDLKGKEIMKSECPKETGMCEATNEYKKRNRG